MSNFIVVLFDKMFFIVSQICVVIWMSTISLFVVHFSKNNKFKKLSNKNDELKVGMTCLCVVFIERVNKKVGSKRVVFVY